MQILQSNLFYCKTTLHVSGDTAPIIRSVKTVTEASGAGHNIGPATSNVARPGVPTWPRWKDV